MNTALIFTIGNVFTMTYQFDSKWYRVDGSQISLTLIMLFCQSHFQDIFEISKILWARFKDRSYSQQMTIDKKPNTHLLRQK